jgi:hypothetical protein
VDAKPCAFDTHFGSKVSQCLKRLDEFRPAVRIPAVIDRIHAEKNVSGRNDFRPGKRISEKKGIACRDLSDWNPTRDFCFRSLFWYIDIIRERGAAKDAHVDLCDTMFRCS